MSMSIADRRGDLEPRARGCRQHALRRTGSAAIGCMNEATTTLTRAELDSVHRHGASPGGMRSSSTLTGS
jgi:hypothetical protein